MLYCALARPLLEYCTPLWSGKNFTNVRLVERVQRSMTRYICNFSADSYKERLIKLNILPLTMRRERNDLISFWKCLRGIYEIDVNNYVTFSNSIDRCTRSSRDEGFLMKVPSAKLKVSERVILTELFIYGILYHKRSDQL